MKVLVLQALVLLATLLEVRSVRLPDPSWVVEVKPDLTRLQRNLENEGPAPTPDASVNCNSKIFMCASCTAARICRPQADNSIVHYQDLQCPSERPYCDETSGSCVSTASLQCGDPNDPFVCLKNNHYFPDPDCTKFHYCDENYVPRLFKCIGEGLVYNAVEQQCVADSDSKFCGNFECDGNELRKIKHTIFQMYFAMCKSEGNANEPLVVGVCPPYYEVNPQTQNCEPDCVSHGNGNIPDSKDCTKYYTCTETELPDGKTYMQRTAKSCPTGQSFDLNLFMCVPDKGGKICQKH